MDKQPRFERLQATVILATGVIGLLSGVVELFSLYPLLAFFSHI